MIDIDLHGESLRETNFKVQREGAGNSYNVSAKKSALMPPVLECIEEPSELLLALRGCRPAIRSNLPTFGTTVVRLTIDGLAAVNPEARLCSAKAECFPGFQAGAVATSAADQQIIAAAVHPRRLAGRRRSFPN